MNLKLLKGYLLAALVILLLGAVAVLLAMNLGDSWDLHVYWKVRTLPRAGWLLLAGAGGLVVYWTVRKLLPAAIASLRQGAAARRAKTTAKDAEKPQKDQQP